MIIFLLCLFFLQEVEGGGELWGTVRVKRVEDTDPIILTKLKLLGPHKMFTLPQQ